MSLQELDSPTDDLRGDCDVPRTFGKSDGLAVLLQESDAVGTHTQMRRESHTYGLIRRSIEKVHNKLVRLLARKGALRSIPRDFSENGHPGWFEVPGVRDVGVRGPSPR